MAESDSSSDNESTPAESSDQETSGDSLTVPLNLEWRQLSSYIRTNKSPLSYLLRHNRDGPGFRAILHNLNGQVVGGEVLAIMGSSGAGKTSLLHLLSRETGSDSPLSRLLPGPTIIGDVLVGGLPFTCKRAKYLSALVAQDDILLPHLTVEETLLYSAQLRVAGTDAYRRQVVDRVISDLGLEKCRHSLVGNATVRGVSGGERKRTSIAFDLLANPRVLFLDEPTTGLDSQTALNLISTVGHLAHRDGRVIVCTIHQPRASIFDIFDKLLLLSDGCEVYNDRANGAIEHFAEQGYECPTLENPADFFLDLLTKRPSDIEQTKHEDGQERVDRLKKAWEQKRIAMLETNMKTAQPQVTVDHKRQRIDERRNFYQAPFFKQLFWLTHRASLHLIRDKPFLIGRLAHTIFISVLLGLMYLQFGTDQKSINNRIGFLFFAGVTLSMNECTAVVNIFPSERAVSNRERRVGMYGVSAYFLSKQIVDVPFVALIGAVFVCITYFFVGLQANWYKFGDVLAILILTCIVANSIGLVIGSLFDEAVGVAVGPFIILVMMLFSGFLVNTKSVPIIIRWVPYLSFLKYSLTALIRTEFQGLTLHCTSSEFETTVSGLVCPITNGQQVIKEFNATDLTVIECIIVLAGWALFYRVLAYLVLRYYNRK